ncbi:hypothetical protein OKC48_04235 [Methylorubrum extorquens]|uniref:hypothetical protein n=1 Tax=Methylorubrum extorquens TaxID=408 RepID=UPI002237C5E9|nr:hypothetical protein [Methylorubrum extorquens]UYW27729.1 hypothetical protein OKC48_04235 [Methylorubrum extorquens]
MADLNNSSWSETDSSNTQPAPSGFPSGILPSQVGGVVRAMMGATKRAYNHGNAMVSSTGSVNAYVLTYEQPLQAGYVKGEVFRFFAHVTNTGASTLNINGAGTRAILRADGSQVAAGEIVIGQVITVVCDGTNFLAQSVVSKDFKSNVSIVKDNDAILTIEDSGTAATSFRRKQIFSTRNDGASGNNWLFRQTRPSDGAIEDFYLKGGTGGTIWTTGNFNPDLKANLAGSVFTGTVSVKGSAGIGQSSLVAGSADRSGYVEFRDKDGARHGYIGWGTGSTIEIAAEKGDYNFVNGTPRIGGNQIWHAGNFNPATKADLNTTPRFAGVLLGTGNGNIYSDTGAHNVVLRSGSGAADQPFKYAAMQADVFRTYSADILADGNLRTNANLVVGEGKTFSTIEMRDTDNGTRFVHNNSNLIGFLGSGGDWSFRVADDGAVWTKQLGDINTRIEDRANAWSASRRDEANTNTANNYFNKATGTQQNVNNIPSFNAAAIDIVRGGVMRARWTVDGGGTTILQNGDNGDNFFYVQSNGQVWTKQFGDLNNRIEDRAAAWARQESVARANERVAKGGDTMTGDLTVSKAYPTLNMLYGGVRHVGWQLREDAQTYLWDHSAGTWQMRVDTGGSVVARGNLHSGNGSATVATNGDVYGSVYGNKWLSTRLAEIDGNANNRVAKTGDTMSGDLTISKANPSVNFFYGGVYSSRLWVGNDAVFRYSHNEGSGDQFRISPGGAVWTAQFGDLNSRIEDRAYAWAATRQANLGYTPVEQGGGPYQSGNKIRLGWDGTAMRLSVDGGDHERVLHRSWINPIIDIRWVHAGDLGNDWNLNAYNGDPYSEPYPGAAITSRYTTSYAAVTYWTGARWRYLQKQDSYGNWYTVGYA